MKQRARSYFQASVSCDLWKQAKRWLHIAHLQLEHCTVINSSNLQGSKLPAGSPLLNAVKYSFVLLSSPGKSYRRLTRLSPLVAYIAKVTLQTT